MNWADYVDALNAQRYAVLYEKRAALATASSRLKSITRKDAEVTIGDEVTDAAL